MEIKESIEFKSEHFDFIADPIFKDTFFKDYIENNKIRGLIKDTVGVEKLEFMVLKIVRSNKIIGGLTLSATKDKNDYKKAITYVVIFDEFKNFVKENNQNYDFTGIVVKEWLETLNKRFPFTHEIMVIVKSSDYNIVNKYTKKDIIQLNNEAGLIKIKKDLTPSYIICSRNNKK
jgi:dihydroneopterin aldolase